MFKLFCMFARYLVVGLPLLSVSAVHSAEYIVSTQSEYTQAAKALNAGDRIVLANRVWSDFEIVFEGQGTAKQPIELTAQTKGQVIISGQSNLRLAGEHLIVSGLVFKDGHTPTSAVISYRKDKKKLANYSRVTEVVIDNFSNPERFENDYWVAMYGKHNRFDHNHLEGKRNKGVTMAVRLNTEASQQNYHKIDHNYFGPRPILGSNGGETLRIGTSHYSLSDSFTTVENNYFDRCDGELEIISNKSGHNLIKGNVFFESRGTLTLRHGNDNIIEDNVFFGNGVDHTGGIRLINKRQTIRNNYMEGLTGTRFGGALVVMNGVPNSSINRYHQVQDSIIENNSIVESDNIQLAAGSDLERSAVPVRTSFKNNLVYNKKARDTFTIYDDISGITFSDNRVNGAKPFQIKEGFDNASFKMKRANNGLLYPRKSQITAGASKQLKPITKAEVGTTWYPKSDKTATFDKGRVIKVKPGLDTLVSALKMAKNSDVLKLSAGEYVVSRVLNLDKAITVKGKGSLIKYERGALFEIQHGGSLKLDGVIISGAESPDSSGNTVIRTSRRSMLTNYELVVRNTEVVDLDINHSFDFLSVAKGTFADKIDIEDSVFNNITGSILKLQKESDDYGIYNAEYVNIVDSSFNNVAGSLIDFYRGGTDESTFGPHLLMQNNAVTDVGNGKRNKAKTFAKIHGVQVTNISGNTIKKSPAIKVLHTVGEPVTRIRNNTFVGVGLPTVEELNSDKLNTAIIESNVVAEAEE